VKFQIKYIIISVWVVLGFVIFLATLDEQVVLSKKTSDNISYVFPEGWGFFTKSPRDTLLDIYSLETTGISKYNAKNFSSANTFGLSRKTRIVGYEGSLVAGLIPRSAWKTTTNEFFNEIENDTSVSLTLDYSFNHFSKGTFLFVQYEPMPYAWAKNNQEKNQKIKYAKVLLK